jgi:hypothetical protein
LPLSAVEPKEAFAGLEVDVPAELRRDHHLVAERCRGFTEDAFILNRTIDLCAIEEGDAFVEGRVIGAYRCASFAANVGDDRSTRAALAMLVSAEDSRGSSRGMTRRTGQVLLRVRRI